MQSRSGHVVVEALFVLPLFLMMVLGFVDLARWELDRLFLWQKARFYTRDLATSSPASATLLQSRLTQLLRASKSDMTGQVTLTPLFAQVEKNPLRKKKRVDVLTLVLRKPVHALSPLFKLTQQQSHLMLKVTAYEVYAVAE